MRLKTVGTTLFVVLTLAACSSAPPPAVPVHASDTYMERLTGSWSGSYWSADTGRRGQITFELEQSEEVAHGGVIMIPADARQLTPAWESHEVAVSPQPLHIEIVRAEDNQLTGTLEPYRDPECDCMLSTSFIGTIRNDSIEGSFVALGGPGHQKQTGRWKVDRKPPS